MGSMLLTSTVWRKRGIVPISLRGRREGVLIAAGFCSEHVLLQCVAPQCFPVKPFASFRPRMQCCPCRRLVRPGFACCVPVSPFCSHVRSEAWDEMWKSPFCQLFLFLSKLKCVYRAGILSSLSLRPLAFRTKVEKPNSSISVNDKLDTTFFKDTNPTHFILIFLKKLSEWSQLYVVNSWSWQNWCALRLNQPSSLSPWH